MKLTYTQKVSCPVVAKILVVIMFTCFSTIVLSQRSCGTDEQDNYLLKTNSVYAMMRQQQAALQKSFNSQDVIPYSGIPDTVDIVVHVINLGGEIGSFNNPGDSAVEAMIDRLNQCFKATYQDPYGLNQAIGVDMGIYFRLARRDTNCMPTNGIVRVNGSGNSNYVTYGVADASVGITQEELANFSYWDNTKYLNIWLVNKVANGIYAGFAYYPPGGKTIYDGEVLAYYCVNNNTYISHETGHYFNLIHTFGSSTGTNCAANTGNCLADGDQVCDTDPHPQNTNGCTTSAINPCTGLPYGNIVYNQMSYSCQTTFTQGQRTRARNGLITSRPSLLNKSTCTLFAYTFTGNGNWDVAANWSNNLIPPDYLEPGSQIIINPAGSGECVLNISQIISYGASLKVNPGKKLKVLGNVQNTNAQNEFNMSVENIEFLDSIGVSTPTGKMTNGGKIQNNSGAKADLVNSLIQKMLDNSKVLSDQKAISHGPEGTNKPQHNGYAYRFGGNADGKDLNSRHNADMGDPRHNIQSVFGTDCTGFLINVLRKSGVGISLCGVADFEPTLRKILGKNNSLYKNVRLENRGLLAPGQIKRGDFMIWPSHDAVVYNSAVMYNSNGNPYPDQKQTKDRTPAEEQAANLSSDRGIHAMDLGAALRDHYFGTTYSVLRLESVDIISTQPSSTSATTATAGGNITYSGGSSVTLRGVVISRTSDFSVIENTLPAAGTGPGTFTVNLSGLTEGATYFVKSFASVGGANLADASVHEGNVVSFVAGEGDNTTYTIGQAHQGGVIFYLDNTSKHGLICATVDAGAAPWDLTQFDAQNYQNYNPVFIGSTNTGTQSGFSNTSAIINVLGISNYAASLCRSYRGEDFNDWYLPSKDELNLMYQNLKLPGILSFSGINSSYYWSSSEIDNKAVWSQTFNDGVPVNTAWKNNIMNVRAIRAF